MEDNLVKNHQRWTIAPYFIVDDVAGTANYYRDKLGFHYERFWNEPPSLCMVKRNGVIIMLAQLPTTGAMRPNRIADPESAAWDAYIWIDDADALYAEFKSKGVKIVVLFATNSMVAATLILRTAMGTGFVSAMIWKADDDLIARDFEV